MIRISPWILAAAVLAAAPIAGAEAAAPAGEVGSAVASPAPLRLAEDSTTTTPGTSQTDEDGGGSDDGGGTDDGDGAPHQ